MWTSCSACGTGMGCSRTELTTAKIAAFAPMHTVSVRTEVTEKPRSLNSMRAAKRRSVSMRYRYAARLPRVQRDAGFLAGWDADIGDGLSLGHRRHGSDEQHDAAVGRPRLEDRGPQVIRDIADLCAFLDVAAARDERVEDAGGVTGNRRDALDPDRRIHDRARAFYHLQIAHDRQGAVHERLDVGGLDGTGVPRLGGD